MVNISHHILKKARQNINRLQINIGQKIIRLGIGAGAEVVNGPSAAFGSGSGSGSTNLMNDIAISNQQKKYFILSIYFLENPSRKTLVHVQIGSNSFCFSNKTVLFLLTPFWYDRWNDFEQKKLPKADFICSIPSSALDSWFSVIPHIIFLFGLVRMFSRRFICNVMADAGWFLFLVNEKRIFGIMMWESNYLVFQEFCKKNDRNFYMMGRFCNLHFNTTTNNKKYPNDY